MDLDRGGLSFSRGRDESSYVAFLQDQVKRLSAVLRAYQKKYLPISEPRIAEDEPLPPWLNNPSVLSPLIVEYDSNIKSLKEHVEFYKHEHESLKDKADKIVHENTRLHEELRKSIETQLDTLQKADGLSEVNQESLDNFQHQLRLINQEKENFREMWENTSRELNSAQAAVREKSQELATRTSNIAVLQDDLQKARQFAEEIQRGNRKLKMEQEQFLQTAQVQDKELDTTRDELRKYKTELKTYKLRNEELTKHLDDLQSQVKLLDKDSQRAITVGKTTEGTIRELQNNILEFESRTTSSLKEIGKIRGEKIELEEQLSHLQKKFTEMEEREYQATLHVRDSVQLVENAMLEREQAVIKEQQRSQEVSRLQEAMNNLVRQGEKKRKQEVENNRAQNSRQIQRLMEEIHYLEVEGAEKQAQLDRALREKSAVEKELEKLYHEGPSEATRAGYTMEEMQKRLSRTEAARDDATLHNESLQSTLRKIETQNESQTATLSIQLGDAKRRIKSLEEQVDTVSGSRLQLLDEIDKLKRQLMAANQKRDEAEVKEATQVASLKQKLEMQGKDFDSRMRATEDLNRQTINELREMLTAQQRVGSKWRDESRSMSQKFESTINELKQELSRLRTRNQELNNMLENEQHKADEFEQDLMTTKVSTEKLQRMTADSEARADAASTQVQTLLNRERHLLQERKTLNREIDKLKLEIARPSRTNEAPFQWEDFLNSSTRQRTDDEPRLSRFKF